MPLIIVGVILLLLKILDIGPVGMWSWLWVLSPFAAAFVWWEVICPLIGWDKKQAEKKMKDDMAEQEAWKKKTRGF
jgi:small Trp-rich protein